MSNKTRASNNIIVIFKRVQIPQKNLEIKLKYHFKKGRIPQKGTDSAKGTDGGTKDKIIKINYIS